jgi:hypothetical protein
VQVKNIARERRKKSAIFKLETPVILMIQKISYLITDFLSGGNDGKGVV